jgi:alkaline phosphatase
MHKLKYLLLIMVIGMGCSKSDDRLPLNPVEPEVLVKKNLILLIGDGMGLTHITAARTVNGGNLRMLECDYVGIQSTHAADRYITDSGASGTAIACGEKTNYHAIGVDVNGNPLQNILEIAQNIGYATALLSTASIVHATPAVFYAHRLDRDEYENIALDLCNANVDFFLGGGKNYFDQRSDDINLIDTLSARGYQVVEDLEEYSGNGKAAIIIAENYPPRYSEGRGDVLSEGVVVALEQMNKNDVGFFMMVEGAQIDWGADSNNEEYLMEEMLDFDRAVGVALDFARQDGNTLVVITADHETGGFTLLNGDEEQHSIETGFMTIEHTGTMVPIFAQGPGAEAFSGVFENKDLFYLFKAYFESK